MVTVTEGPHKDVIGVTMTERGARDDLIHNVRNAKTYELVKHKQTNPRKHLKKNGTKPR